MGRVLWFCLVSGLLAMTGGLSGAFGMCAAMFLSGTQWHPIYTVGVVVLSTVAVPTGWALLPWRAP